MTQSEVSDGVGVAASRTRICGEFLLPLENSIGPRRPSPVARRPSPVTRCPGPLVGVGDAVGVSDGVGVAASRTRICGEFLLPLENSIGPRPPSSVPRRPSPVTRCPDPSSESVTQSESVTESAWPHQETRICGEFFTSTRELDCPPSPVPRPPLPRCPSSVVQNRHWIRWLRFEIRQQTISSLDSAEEIEYKCNSFSFRVFLYSEKTRAGWAWPSRK